MPLAETEILNGLIQAEINAAELFRIVEARGLIAPGYTEQDVSDKVYEIAFERFGIKKYWHKRIVRSGVNTLLPYDHNPENLTIQEDDIVFLDFGPVFEDWEADYGRSFVLGPDPEKHKLNHDLEVAFKQAKQFYESQAGQMTGSEFYTYLCELALAYGWVYGGPYAGHLVGQFPHQNVFGNDVRHYIHPENHTLMSDPDQFGNKRHWILEIHFIQPNRKFGGFFEQLLIPFPLNKGG